MNSKSLQELISNLQVFYKCPSCGSRYEMQDITFLGRVDEHCFMQLTCGECSLPILATVLLSSKLGSKVSAKSKYYGKQIRKTDLGRGEKKRFSHLPPISAHEVADLHLYLSEHVTDLHTQF